jgi:hypothetical protein
LVQYSFIPTVLWLLFPPSFILIWYLGIYLAVYNNEKLKSNGDGASPYFKF